MTASSIPVKAKQWRRWTDDETELLRLLIYQGKTWHGIARSLGRSVSSVQNRRFVAKINARAVRGDYGGWQSVQQVRQLLGLSWHAMQRITTNGDLQTTKKSAHRRCRYVSDDDLRQFLADWRFFMEWHPSLIRDPDWRIYGQECRDAIWGRWLTISDLAYELNVTNTTVFRWIQRRHFPCVQRGDRWYIWSRHLDGWPPLQGRRL